MNHVKIIQIIPLQFRSVCLDLELDEHSLSFQQVEKIQKALRSVKDLNQWSDIKVGTVPVCLLRGLCQCVYDESQC